MVLECRICCTSLVGTHMWCRQPQLLWVMSRLFWTDICRHQCSLAEKELSMTEKWCRCNVSRLNGLSALRLSQCSCLRTLLTSKGPANLQNADKEWALVMLTVYSFVKLAFISTNSHIMRDVTIRHFEGILCRRERQVVWSRGQAGPWI